MVKKDVRLIRITEKNFMWLASRIKKFLEHDVVAWHNFDCGNKRHINSMIWLQDPDWCKTDTIVRYSSPKVTIVTPKTEPLFNKCFIRMNLAKGFGGIIEIGDYVGFTGNRMHLKSRFPGEMHTLIYECYQIWDPNGPFKDIRPAWDPIMEDIFG